MIMKKINELTKQIKYNDGWFAALADILPNPDTVLRRTGKTIEAYRELKNDAHVWSCVQSRKSGLLSLDFQIIANGANDAVVREIEQMIKALDINKIEREILEAPLFGYQPMEIIWEVQRGKRYRIVPVDFVAKPQEWFFFDGERKLRYKKKGEAKGVPVPEHKIINVLYEASYLNPYGNALLQKCYWPVVFKNGSLKFWVNFTEKFGMPILMGSYGRGGSQEDADKLLDALSSLVEDSVIVAPEDVKLELHEAGKSSSVALYRDLIKFCNAEISKAVLSQTLTTELDMGSYAASQTHFKIRKEVILSDIRLVESTMNKLIKEIVDLNFAPPYPRFSLAMNDSDNMQMVERDTRLAQTGQVKFTKEYWMRTYGFKEEDLEAENGEKES
jgi:phage gp29-like protein